MFKKNVAVLNNHQLSGKDVKKLKRDIEAAYPGLSEEQLKVLLPSKAEVTTAKLTNKTVVYFIGGGNPMFFDPDGRGQLYPTVYALWMFPNIVPAIYTHSEVSPKVLGGADLFLQGVIVPPEGLPDFQSGTTVTIQIPESKHPFAIGEMQCDKKAAVSCGMKGKGVKLLHHFPDLLWGLGDKTTPDKGFTLDRIFPEDSSRSSATEEGTGPDTSATAEHFTELQIDEPAAAQEPAASSSVSSPSPQHGAPPSVDSILESCLLDGLVSLPDSALPIISSDFYSKYMLPNRPEGMNVDIKKSSYKKLSKLLTVFEKKGMLTQKLIHKQEHISAVNRTNELYIKHDDATVAGAIQAAATSTAPVPPVPSFSKIQVSYCYKVPSSLRPVFVSLATRSDNMFSGEEVGIALRQYAAAEGLLVGEAGVKLDKLMLGHLFNKKEAGVEGDEVALEDLEQRLLGKLQKHHRIVRQTSEGVVDVVNKGDVRSVRVSTEDRQGGRKHITKVVGLEAFAIDPDELATILQRKFQTSCSVTKLPGKNETGKEIAMQGNLAVDVLKFLSGDYGLGEEYIEVKGKGKSGPQ